MNERSLAYYKSLNYKIQVEFSAEDDRWYARIPELWDTLVDAETPVEALQKAFGLKDEILEMAYKEGRDIPLPRPDIEYSGRFLLRVPKTLHAKLAAEAEREGTSINRLAIQFLSAELERRQTLRMVSDEIKSTFYEIMTRPFSGFQSIFGRAIHPEARQNEGTIILPLASTASQQMLVATDKAETEDILTDSVPSRRLSI